jgi:hypothetical protein
MSPHFKVNSKQQLRGVKPIFKSYFRHDDRIGAIPI